MTHTTPQQAILRMHTTVHSMSWRKLRAPPATRSWVQRQGRKAEKDEKLMKRRRRAGRGFNEEQSWTYSESDRATVFRDWFNRRIAPNAIWDRSTAGKRCRSVASNKVTVTATTDARVFYLDSNVAITGKNESVGRRMNILLSLPVGVIKLVQ